MNILNPFSKEGKQGTSFIDRIAIAAIFLFVILLSIAVPLLIVAWYKKADDYGRAIFWLFFIGMYLLSFLTAFC